MQMGTDVQHMYSKSLHTYGQAWLPARPSAQAPPPPPTKSKELRPSHPPKSHSALAPGRGP